MRRALREYEITGIKTTLPFFREVMEDPEFISGELDTAFIQRFRERRKPREPDQTAEDLAIIAAALSLREAKPAVNGTSGTLSAWARAGRLAAFNNQM
jgi:acetyl-CoA carboxylase biotin carboxylase subunit